MPGPSPGMVGGDGVERDGDAGPGGDRTRRAIARGSGRHTEVQLPDFPPRFSSSLTSEITIPNSVRQLRAALLADEVLKADNSAA